MPFIILQPPLRLPHILLFAVLVLHFPSLADPDNTVPHPLLFLLQIARRPGQHNPAPFSCMSSSIPLLANTQVPVICSVCHSGLGGPLLWHG